MPGNPFKPKAGGYSAPQDPVGRLQEVVAKLSGQIENVFQSFTHLGDSVRAMDRQATRIAFMGAIAAGPRSPIPYDFRDIIRHSGGGHSTGIRRAGPYAGPPVPVPGGGSYRPGSPVSGRSTPPPVPQPSRSRVDHMGVRVDASGFPVNSPVNPARPKGGLGYNAGGSVPPGRNWTNLMVGPGGWQRGRSAHHAIPGAGPGEGPPGSPPNLRGGLTQAFFGSSIIGAGLTKEGSPLAADTVGKSFELMLAKFGHGTLGPSAFLSRNMQSAGRFADRNPELADLIGKTVLVTAGLTGLAVVINILAAAAKNAAASLEWLSLKAGMKGGVPLPGGGAGGVPPVVPAGGGKGGFWRGLARNAGPLALLVGGLEAHGSAADDAGPAKALLDEPFMNRIPGWLHKQVTGRTPGESVNKILGSLGMGTGEKSFGWGMRNLTPFGLVNERMKNNFGIDLNPFGGDEWRKKQTESFLPSTASKVHPMFTQLEDVYKQATLAALESPIDQEKNTTQRKNDLEFQGMAMGEGIAKSESFQQALRDGTTARRN